jgi:chemotaxis protein methyltransferase CheR
VLYLGGAETVLGITDRFAAVAGERGVYEPAPGAGARTAAA